MRKPVWLWRGNCAAPKDPLQMGLILILNVKGKKKKSRWISRDKLAGPVSFRLFVP